MVKNAIHSFAFAMLVLVLVLLGKVNTNKTNEPLITQTISSTSVYANNNLSKPYFLVRPALLVAPHLKNDHKQKQLSVNIDAAAAFAKDLINQHVYLSYNSYAKWPIASITKLMTALVAIEKVGVNKEIEISEEAVKTEGVSGDFKAGEIFTVSDLIKAMLVVSSNDAAAAIAEFYGKENFVAEMNKKAEVLNMSDTHFEDPTGLSPLNQSTIGDLEKLVMYLWQNNRDLFDISRSKQVVITEQNSKINRVLNNINYFAGRSEFLGGKTGYIDEAGGNLVAVFNNYGRPLLIIVFGADDRFAETEKIYNNVIN